MPNKRNLRRRPPSETFVMLWLITMVSLVLVVLILATTGGAEWVVGVVENWPVPW